jgi:hypothetical protein
MCAPGLIVSFARAGSLIHTIQIRPASMLEPDGKSRFDAGSFLVSPQSECDIDPDDPGRVFNPVYQELVQHELPAHQGAGLCVLLTGSAFQHHFSAVFGLYRDRTKPSSIILDVDLADRVRAPIALLAVTYSIHRKGGNPELIDATAGTLAWRGGSLGDGTLELLADPPARLGTPEARQWSTIVRVEARIDPQTFTQRLHYCWRWTSCADATR